MPATYEPIATTTLSSRATITFSSIPSTYTDLRLVLTGRAVTAGASLIRFNSDLGTNYSFTTIYGDGLTAGSQRLANSSAIYLYYYGYMDSVIPTFATVDIFSYAGSTNKTCLVSSSADFNGSGTTERIVGLWRNTSAISTITLTMGTGNYEVGTTATLYGIKSA